MGSNPTLTATSDLTVRRMGNWAEGRVVLVTGATSGFGLAVARRFHVAGARVIAAGRRRERLDELAGWGVRVLPVTLDVRDRAAVDRTIAELPAEFAAIDVLFNNAGLALGLNKAQAGDPADWDVVIDTNVKGLTWVARAVLPGMIERGRGDVINVGSVAGTYPYPGGNVYGATKAYVHQFSLNLRADLIGTPIRVTCLEPGLVQTEFSRTRFKGDAENADKVYRGVDALDGEDIAEVVEAIVRLPGRINLNVVEVMPVAQAFGPFAFDRREI